MSGKWNWLRKLLRSKPPQPPETPDPRGPVIPPPMGAKPLTPSIPSKVRLDAQGFPIAYFSDPLYGGEVIYQQRLAAFVHIPFRHEKH